MISLISWLLIVIISSIMVLLGATSCLLLWEFFKPLQNRKELKSTSTPMYPGMHSDETYVEYCHRRYRNEAMYFETVIDFFARLELPCPTRDQIRASGLIFEFKLPRSNVQESVI